MSIDIKISLTPELDALFAGLEDDVHAAVKEGLLNLVEELDARAASEAPVRSSNLVNSLTSYLTDNGYTGVIKATAPYAEHVHEGTGVYGPNGRPIVIAPTNKKALFWPGAAHPVKKVVQQGVRPNPFFDRAAASVDAQAVFDAAVQNYLKRRNA